MMKIKNITFLAFVVMAILLITFVVLTNQRAYRLFLAHQFNGCVERIEYNKQGIPYVTIESEEYYLNVGWDHDHIIEVGDSLIKKRGELTVKLIKHKNGKVFIFDHM